MRETTGPLLTLLKHCAEGREEAEKLELLARITQSREYTFLRDAEAFQKPFEEIYTWQSLTALGIDELRQREALLPKLTAVNARLVQSIHSGNAYELSSEDFPNFTSDDSVSRLLSKIRISPDKCNYSNIPDEEALILFSEKTVKSPQTCLQMLPLSVSGSDTITEEMLNACMGTMRYCIPISEFTAAHRTFLELSEKSKRLTDRERLRFRRHRLWKAAVSLLCLGAVFSVSQFGLVLESDMPLLYTVVMAGATVFMIGD